MVYSFGFMVGWPHKEVAISFGYSTNLRALETNHKPETRNHKPHLYDSQPPPFHIFAAMKILMVCLGNICRSPLAEGILQQKANAAGLDWQVDSAGTNGYHVGEAPHRLSQKVAQARGLDISGQRARRFTADDFARFDFIYAMAGDVIDDMRRISGDRFDAGKTGLLMDVLFPGKQMDVPDPWYGPEPGYHEVYDMIEAACDQLITQTIRSQHV